MQEKGKWIIRLNADSLAMIAFVIYFSVDFFRAFSIKIFGHIGFGGLGIVFINLVIYSFLILSLLKRSRKLYDCVCFFIIILVLFAFTYMLHPDYRFYLTRPVYGFTTRVLRPDRAIYAFLMIRCMRSSQSIWKGLKYVAWIEFIFYIYEFIDFLRVGYWLDYNSIGEISKYTYNLSYGYSVTFPIVIFITWALKEKKKVYDIPAAILLLAMLMAGSRGAIVVILMFIALIMYCYTTTLNLVKYLSIVVMGMITVVFVGFDNIILSIASFGSKMGISSRTLTKLAAGTITDGTGRDLIYDAAWGIIKEHKFFGAGLFGDRPVIVQYHNAGYCHNIFLELASNFGLIIAAIVIVLILFFSYKIMVVNKDREWKLLFIIFFSVSCQLFFSMSYWFVPSFWAMLGIFASYTKERKLKGKSTRMS